MLNNPLEGWVMVICNPTSGSGLGPQILRKVLRSFGESGVRYNSELTQKRGHATRLARAAVDSGASAIVAIGRGRHPL